MDTNSAAGTKVVYIDENGYDSDKERARAFLVKGQVLTVERLDVGRSSSTVEFEEFPGRRFNTVMFKNDTPTWERYDWFARECYMGITPKTDEDFAKMPFDPDDMSDAAIRLRNTLTDSEDIEQEFCHSNFIHHEEDEPPEDYPIVDKQKRRIVTAKLGERAVSVIDPKDEDEVIAAFMNQYGEEPRQINTLYIVGNVFDPHDLGVSDRY